MEQHPTPPTFPEGYTVRERLKILGALTAHAPEWWQNHNAGLLARLEAEIRRDFQAEQETRREEERGSQPQPRLTSGPV
jgi:hypothetical protein